MLGARAGTRHRSSGHSRSRCRCIARRSISRCGSSRRHATRDRRASQPAGLAIASGPGTGDCGSDWQGPASPAASPGNARARGRPPCASRHRRSSRRRRRLSEIHDSNHSRSEGCAEPRMACVASGGGGRPLHQQHRRCHELHAAWIRTANACIRHEQARGQQDRCSSRARWRKADHARWCGSNSVEHDDSDRRWRESSGDCRSHWRKRQRSVR